MVTPKRGFSLVEVLVSVALLTALTLVATKAQLIGLQASARIDAQQQALAIAHSVINAIKAQPDLVNAVTNGPVALDNLCPLSGASTSNNASWNAALIAVICSVPTASNHRTRYYHLPDAQLTLACTAVAPASGANTNNLTSNNLRNCRFTVAWRLLQSSTSVAATGSNSNNSNNNNSNYGNTERLSLLTYLEA